MDDLIAGRTIPRKAKIQHEALFQLNRYAPTSCADLPIVRCHWKTHGV